MLVVNGFVQALQKEFSSEALSGSMARLVISLTTPAREEYVERGFDLEKLQEYVVITTLFQSLINKQLLFKKSILSYLRIVTAT